MTQQAKQKRTCNNGHIYYKSTDCPTCPICEKEKQPSEGFLSLLSSPARSVLLQYLGVDTLEKLSAYTEKEILDLHGMGKASMPILRKALEEKGLTFKDEGFVEDLSVPARRALENEGIKSAEKLAGYTEKEILSLHGIGPSSIPKMKNALKKRGLRFKEN